jgi:YVTN family beta-propeller protein
MTCVGLAGCLTLALFYSVSLTGAQPAGPKAYIGLIGNSAVAVLDTSSNQVMSTIPVPTGPHGMVMTPDNSRVYVSSDGNSTVSVIDTTIDQVTDFVEVGPSPHGLAITPDGSSVLVAGFGSDTVSAIDTASNEIAWSVPIVSPHNFAISPDGMVAYVASQDNAAPALAILSLLDQQFVNSVPLNNIPLTLSFSADGSQLWFTEAGVDAVQVLDPATNAITSTIAVGAGPDHVMFTSALGLVASQDAGELALLDPGTGTNLATVLVGSLPHWIAATADGLTAFVTNQGSNDVSMVDLTTATVTATIPIGFAPFEIVIQSGPLVTPPAAPVPVPVPAPAPPPQAMGSVSMVNLAFSPPTMTVAVGGSVTWTNMDPPELHTTTSDLPGWDSGLMSQGDTFTMTFNDSGTFDYHCNTHSFMHGMVIVSE